MYGQKKNILTKTITTLFIAVCIFAISSCAVKTKIYEIKPAEVSLQGIKTLAILKFTGKYGESVRSDFYNRLTNVKHFNLIDTTNVNTLDKIIFDQIDDPRFLPELEALHADGIITGRVTADINDRHGSDQMQMQEGTGRYKKGTNIFGQEVDVEIMRTVLKPVKYVIRQASLTTDFKVFDLRTKKIIATGKVTKNYNEKFGGKNDNFFSGKTMSKLPAKNQTLNELSSLVSIALVAKISPTQITNTVYFDDGGTLGIGGHKGIKRGIEFAKRGDWEDAIEIWNDIIKTEQNNASAYYNLGIAYESFKTLNNLQKALTLYKKAVRNGDKTLYLDAMARTKNKIKNRKKYDQQKQMLNNKPAKRNKGSQGLRIY